MQKELEANRVERAWQRTRVYKAQSMAQSMVQSMADRRTWLPHATWQEEAQRGRKRAAHFRQKAEKEMAQQEGRRFG